MKIVPALPLCSFFLLSCFLYRCVLGSRFSPLSHGPLERSFTTQLLGGLRKEDGVAEDTPVAYKDQYYEHSYYLGLFTSSAILNVHVPLAILPTMIRQRSSVYFPYSISAFSLSSTSTGEDRLVYYNVLWLPNSKSLKWTFVYDVDGPGLQTAMTQAAAAGQKPKQVESYEHKDKIFYAAVFISSSYWPAKTTFSSVFGSPFDDSYCCSNSSRWTQLLLKGYRPTSLSITENPLLGGLYVSDVWDSVNVGIVQGGINKTPEQLRETLSSLPSSLTPVYIKAYRRSNRYGGHDIFFSYIAYKATTSSPLPWTLTTDVSSSGLQLLAELVTKAPVTLTGVEYEAARDENVPGSGDIYSAIWAV